MHTRIITIDQNRRKVYPWHGPLLAYKNIQKAWQNVKKKKHLLHCPLLKSWGTVVQTLLLSRTILTNSGPFLKREEEDNTKISTLIIPEMLIDLYLFNYITE